jgi:quercetin dioxygenase-like cupin family protein
MACFHLHGDASGETHIARLQLPLKETYAGTVRGWQDIPTTTAGMGQFVGRKPDVGVHNAPRRQLLIVLEGELELIATGGDNERLRPGDVLLADDGGTKGHISRDVGDEPLMLMAVGIDSSWVLPTS